MFLPGFIWSTKKYKHKAVTFQQKSSAEREVVSASTTKDTLVMLLVCAVEQPKLVMIPWLLRAGAALQLPPGPHALDLFLFESQAQGEDVETDGVCLGFILRWRWAALENVPTSQILAAAQICDISNAPQLMANQNQKSSLGTLIGCVALKRKLALAILHKEHSKRMNLKL